MAAGEEHAGFLDRVLRGLQVQTDHLGHDRLGLFGGGVVGGVVVVRLVDGRLVVTAGCFAVLLAASVDGARFAVLDDVEHGLVLADGCAGRRRLGDDLPVGVDRLHPVASGGVVAAREEDAGFLDRVFRGLQVQADNVGHDRLGLFASLGLVDTFETVGSLGDPVSFLSAPRRAPARRERRATGPCG